MIPSWWLLRAISYYKLVAGARAYQAGSNYKLVAAAS